MNHEEMIAAVRARYAHAPLLTLGGVDQPVAIWTAPGEQRCDVDSAIGVYEPSDTERGTIGDRARLAAILERTEAAGRTLFDGTIAAMRRLHKGDLLALDWSPGLYFDQLASCESDAVHDGSCDPLVDGKGRCAGIGVSTVTRVATDDGPRVWLGCVSGQKPTHGGLLHVMPAAMLEPNSSGAVSITDTVLREFAEELFGLQGTGEQWWNDTEPIAELRAIFDDGDASLEFTGIAMNLVNLRPEVCTLLRIDTPTWCRRWRDRLAMNWEFEGALHDVRFEDEDEFANDLGDDIRALVPPAAGAIGLALAQRD